MYTLGIYEEFFFKYFADKKENDETTIMEFPFK